MVDTLEAGGTGQLAETINKPESSLDPMDDKGFENFMKLGFHFNQGRGEIQDDMEKWAAGMGYLDKISPLTDELPDWMKKLDMPKDHLSIPGYEKNDIVAQIWENTKAIVQEKDKPLDMEEQARKILDGQINRDINYQTENRSPGGVINPLAGIENPDGREDPHASWIRKYGIKQQDALHPVYTEMWQKGLAPLIDKVRPALEAPTKEASQIELGKLSIKDQELARNLGNLKTRWELKHKRADGTLKEPFFLPKATTQETVSR